MSLGGNKSSSKSDPGYFDPDTQNSVDWLKNTLMGEKGQGELNPDYDPNYSKKNPYTQSNLFNPGTAGFGGKGSSYAPATGASGFNMFGNAQKWNADNSYRGNKHLDGERSGGLFDTYSDTSNKIFKGSGNDYQTTKFTSDYTPTDFMSGANGLTETTVNPESWDIYGDMISGGASRNANAQIQKMQDEAAYQGRGGGDLADYRASKTLRDTNASTADELRKLSAQRMQQEFENKADVKKYNADDLFARTSAEDASKQYADTSLFGRQQATESANQFGKNYKNDYLKSKLGELTTNKEALSDLMKLIASSTEAFKKGGSSRSSSSGFSMSAQ